MARVHLLRALHARARLSRARRRPIFFLRIRLVAAVAPSTASYGVASTSAGSHQEGDGSRPCARARISAVHFIRWRYGAARRAGFLLALAVAVELGGQDRRRRLAPGGSRAPKIASALNLHPKGSRVHLLRALHARARLSRARRRPIFFLRIRLVAAVAPSTASYGVASTSAGSHQEGDGSRPCARARISAVHFIRWRYGAARRAGLSNNREQGDGYLEIVGIAIRRNRHADGVIAGGGSVVRGQNRRGN